MISPILSKAIGIDNKLISWQTHPFYDEKFQNEGFAKNQLLRVSTAIFSDHKKGNIYCELTCYTLQFGFKFPDHIFIPQKN